MDIEKMVNDILDVAERIVNRHIRMPQESEERRRLQKMVCVYVLLYWMEKKVTYEDISKEDLDELFEPIIGKVILDYEIIQLFNHEFWFDGAHNKEIETSRMARTVLQNATEQYFLTFQVLQSLRTTYRPQDIYRESYVLVQKIVDYICQVNQMQVSCVYHFVYHKPDADEEQKVETL